jgi:pilus assembly protein Flp/PilA
MKSWFSYLALFRRNDSGATAVEYAMIGILIGVAIIGGATVFGKSVNARFQSVSAAVVAAGP